MKVLQVITDVSPRYGGPTVVCLEMSEALAEIGIDVEVFTTDRDYPDGRLDVPLGQPVPRDGYTIWYYPFRSPYLVSWQMAKALRERISEFDVVHIHGLYRFPQAVANFFAARRDVPHLVMTHGSLDPFLYNGRKNRLGKRVYERLIEFRNLNRASAIHFTAEDEMALVAPLGLKAPGIVIPNGLHLEPYKELPEPGLMREKYGLGDKKIIIHLGRLNFKKGLDILVDAFALLCKQRDDVALVLAGPDNNEGYGDKVRRMLRDNGLLDRCVFTGMLRGAEVLEAYRDADVFALPSYTENFGIVVIEALACGTPVVISDKVNIWREVKASGSGLVTSTDAEQVAAAFETLLSDPERCREMGELGKTFVAKEYDWTIVVQRIKETYEELVARS